MAERTVTQADALGLIATVLLALAIIVAAVFVFTGLTTPATTSPQAIGTVETTTQPDMQPAPEELPADQPPETPAPAAN